MIISQMDEAIKYDVVCTEDDIEKSNKLLTESLRLGFDSGDMSKVKENYNSIDNPVIIFNKDRIYLENIEL
jgi:hypothetical protein